MADSQKKKRTRSLPRLWIQAAFAALSNGYVRGFTESRIYKGPLKRICVPGMNCYSCPGALGACPIGSLQRLIGSGRIPLYVLGFLVFFGSLLGRFVCGFLCPFGLIQDLLYRIPFFKKLKKLPGEKFLNKLRYVFLAVFVILLPLFIVDITGQGQPWFCKYICPVGTLEGGIWFGIFDSAIRSSIGFLYHWKVVILIVFLILSLLVYRPFCRYICPLGAIYGLFNRIALVRYTLEPDHCVSCHACENACPMDLSVMKQPNGIDCVRCGACVNACPTGALHIRTPFQHPAPSKPGNTDKA